MSTSAKVRIPRWTPAYRIAVRKAAKRLKSDGCSGPALQVYKDACLEHDVHYRTHRWVWRAGDITKAAADVVFRERLKEMSWLDGFSPLAQWRYFAVRLLGGPAWRHEDRGSPVGEGHWWLAQRGCGRGEAP